MMKFLWALGIKLYQITIFRAHKDNIIIFIVLGSFIMIKMVRLT